MTRPQTRSAPFVSGWRAVAVNLVSGSFVVAALSSALVATAGGAGARLTGVAVGAPVQLGAAPVAVEWPEASSTAYVDVDLSSGTAVLDGLHPGSAVDACSAAWSSTGTCSGQQVRLAVGRDGRLPSAPLGSSVAHLKVTAGAGTPLEQPLVLRAFLPA